MHHTVRRSRALISVKKDIYPCRQASHRDLPATAHDDLQAPPCLGGDRFGLWAGAARRKHAQVGRVARQHALYE